MKPRLLEQILDQPNALSVRFQPIVRITENVHEITSFEGLIRGPAGTHFERADILFDYVRRKHAEAPVDRSCIATICKAVADLPADYRINLNVHASTLGQNPAFVDFFRYQVQNLSLQFERFTLEIVEHSPVYNVPGLTCNLRALRDLGVRIALDDVGLGNSNYRMILDCHPDYFKLDAFFVDGLSNDPERRAVVKSVLCMAEEMKGVVVAEGVNSREDLSTLMQMGIELFQANILCPPLRINELLTQGFLPVQSAGRQLLRGASAEVFERSRRKVIASAARHAVCQ
jgi:EAL domain-containing protein (putative c-di-GMP-specific phosphodiesterase class I)